MTRYMKVQKAVGTMKPAVAAAKPIEERTE
jgi:hypothetical protein